jgi:hypothetical protein
MDSPLVLDEKITTCCAVVWRFEVLEEQRAGPLLLGLSCPVVSPSHGGYTLMMYEDHCCRASFVFKPRKRGKPLQFITATVTDVQTGDTFELSVAAW